MRSDVTVERNSTSAVDGPSASSEAPFKMSVMLWTMGMDGPVDERRDKVAAARYRVVELAGEYHTWSKHDLRRHNEKRHALGATFDATAGAVVARGGWHTHARRCRWPLGASREVG
jgi:hypothetical protein